MDRGLSLFLSFFFFLVLILFGSKGLQAATNIALDLDERPMPRGPIFPRYVFNRVFNVRWNDLLMKVSDDGDVGERLLGPSTPRRLLLLLAIPLLRVRHQSPHRSLLRLLHDQQDNGHDYVVPICSTFVENLIPFLKNVPTMVIRREPFLVDGPLLSCTAHPSILRSILIPSSFFDIFFKKKYQLRSSRVAQAPAYSNHTPHLLGPLFVCSPRPSSLFPAATSTRTFR